jgi:hypothetical protein
MKATLEFDLPEDDHEFQRAAHAMDYELALHDLQEWLRSKRKYTDRADWPDLDAVWEVFHRIMIDRGVEL